MIELHSSPTPNGQKVMIMLEETGLEWKHYDINIRLGEQFTADFLKLSPNNKIPGIVDTGIFLEMADVVLVGEKGAVRELR